MIVCYSRCLVCMRKTPHEVCHEHSDAMGGAHPAMVPTDDLQEDGTPYYDFPEAVRERGWALPAEECTDTACPQRAADWQ